MRQQDDPGCCNQAVKSPGDRRRPGIVESLPLRSKPRASLRAACRSAKFSDPGRRHLPAAEPRWARRAQPRIRPPPRPTSPGPIPKASASRRGLPRIRSTSCPCIVFRPREPGIGPVAWRGINPPVIPPSPACSFLQFFGYRTPGECLVSWRLRARRHGSGILFRWFGDGELCGRVLDRN